MANSNISSRQSDFVVVGLMSGTSMDGVDIAFCSFTDHNLNWQYKILLAETLSYNEYWKNKLSKAHLVPGYNLIKLDRDYGYYLGEIVKKYITQTGIKIHLISSHGHTVFHKPDDGYTLQIGHGANIASITGTPVVYDFRSTDVAKGGQGAPLVPVGDKMLFTSYDSCLNLGGFANISFDIHGNRVAFDICPVNIVLNLMAKAFGLEFDKDGLIGHRGSCDNRLLEKLNGIEYYKKSLPKSLSREWFESVLLPIINEHKGKAEDKMATVYAHIVIQISEVIDSYNLRNMLVTGGGAFNSLLIKLLQNKLNTEIIIPDEITIKYKEALIFAFLGFLRFHQQINCLSSVTGAHSDSICGALCEP